jgi:hypothetical protein
MFKDNISEGAEKLASKFESAGKCLEEIVKGESVYRSL